MGLHNYIKALRIYLALSKEKVRHNVTYKKNFEKRKAFYSQFGDSTRELFIDVGANIGNRTELFISLANRVVAIEPQAICAQVLRFRFGSKIELLEVGLDSAPGVKEIFLSSSHTLSTFSDEWINKAGQGRFSNAVWKRDRKVAMRTLDSIIDEYGTPSFVKIDVEGFEKNIITSLTKPFKYLSFEVNHPENLEDTMAILTYLDRTFREVSFRFSRGESLSFHHNKWLDYEGFFELESGLLGGETVWGDIYVKHG